MFGGPFARYYASICLETSAVLSLRNIASTHQCSAEHDKPGFRAYDDVNLWVRSLQVLARNIVADFGGRNNTSGDVMYSPLLNFPAELRNEVWDYVLVGLDLSSVTTGLYAETNTLSILFVNRQIHEETNLLAYSLNTFTFKWLQDMNTFLARRTAQ